MNKPDWEEIKAGYCSGTPIRQLAREYGVSHTGVRKKATEEGWKKVSSERKMRPGSAAYGVRELHRHPKPRESKLVPGRSVLYDEILTEKEADFVSYYLLNRDKYVAYKQAGFTGSDRHARMVYRKPHVNRAIQRGLAKVRGRLELKVEDILNHWAEIAIADPNEIMQYRRTCCRYCWGKDFHWQWSDEREFEQAQREAASEGKSALSDAGGYGYVRVDDPNPDCPRCMGEGEASVKVADTRDLTGPARRLYAGVKKTKNGIEILTRDQDAALKNLATFHALALSAQEQELRQLEIEYKRLVNSRLQALLDENNDEVLPVQITVDVVDASMEERDDEHYADA